MIVNHETLSSILTLQRTFLFALLTPMARVADTGEIGATSAVWRTIKVVVTGKGNGVFTEATSMGGRTLTMELVKFYRTVQILHDALTPILAGERTGIFATFSKEAGLAEALPVGLARGGTLSFAGAGAGFLAPISVKAKFTLTYLI
jgi:hypothetical protein